MLKKAACLLIIFTFYCTPLLALNLSRVKTWGSEVLTAGDLNGEFDNILNHSITNADISASAAIVASKLDLTVASAIGTTTPAAGAFTTLSSTGNTTIGDAAADTLHVNANTISFEGATADAVEHIVTFTDPTSSDKTLTIPNANSVTLPTGAVFFMVTGSCPAGTTNVSATYSNKFIKINATAGTSSGVVLTGATDSHVLTTNQIPAHTHTYDKNSNGAGSAPGSGETQSHVSTASGSTGGGEGHTHNLSTATTLEPSSITMILCQVD